MNIRAWNSDKKATDRKYRRHSNKNSGAFSFGRGGSMVLDMHDIGKAIYESIPH
jgi:hypothetical protein